jgi:hypothetical protein
MYADQFPILRQLMICLQAAEELSRKLPECTERRRVREHVEAAERAANLLDAQLVEEDQIARDRLEIAEVAQ